MDFKQRMMAALNHEEPDRVPVMGLILDQATINQVMGRKPSDLIGLLKKPVIGGVMKGLMNSRWFWDRMQYGVFSQALDTALRLGFDANWTLYWTMQLVPDAAAPAGVVWHDIFGRLWEIGTDEKGNVIANYSRALCETEEQWEAWVERKRPLFDKAIASAAAFHKKLAAAYGDRILPIGFAAPGMFENSWQPIGFVNFTRFVYEKPAFVRRVIDFYADFYLRYLEAVMQPGIDVVLGGDDLGQKTGPLMRPELIDKLYGESYRRVAEAVHRRGKKFIFHCCGCIYKFLDKFVDWGFDGLLTLEPTAGMDLGKVREQVGHKLALIGNLDVSYLLVKGSRHEIEEAVKQCIRAAAPGGGYVLSASHSHSMVDAERLRWMVEAAHTWGKYPIRV